MATSSNFTTEFGVSNFVYDASDEGSSDNSSSGGGPSLSLTETEPGPEPQPTSTTPNEIENTPDRSGDLKPTPYVPPLNDGYVRVPETVEEAKDECAVVFQPRYRANDLVNVTPESISYYTVLDSDQGVKLTMSTDTFLLPNTIRNAESNYSVCLNFKDHRLPWQQKPDSEYAMILVQNLVYTLSAIDSEGKVIQRFNSPVTVTIDTNGLTQNNYLVSSYEFDKQMAAWFKLRTIKGGGDELSFSVFAPALFGLWQGEALPDRMFVEIESDEDSEVFDETEVVKQADSVQPLFDRNLILLILFLILVLLLTLILLLKQRGSKNRH